MNSLSETSFLAVDVGNTAIKVGRFQRCDHDVHPEPVDVIRMDARSPDFDALRAWLPDEVTLLLLGKRLSASSTRDR